MDRSPGMTTMTECPDYLAIKTAFDEGGMPAAKEAFWARFDLEDRDWATTSEGYLMRAFFLATEQEERAARVPV
jgi:hypothetical protein